MLRNQYKIKPNVTLKNRVNNQTVVGDIVGEEEIDGKQFWIIRSNNRALKLAKDAYGMSKK